MAPEPIKLTHHSDDEYSDVIDRYARVNRGHAARKSGRGEDNGRGGGGVGGGGTSLTVFGKNIVAGFSELQEEHNAFINRLGSNVSSMSELAKFLRSTTLRTSARNQFRGQIKKITRGGVNTDRVTKSMINKQSNPGY